MANVSLSHPFDEIHGALGRTEKVINRQKKYRDDRGRIIREGIQEAYVVKHPRDYRKTPPKGAELAVVNLWSEACRRAAQILFAHQFSRQPEEQQEAMLSAEHFHRQLSRIPDYYTIEEAQTLYDAYRTRYQAQLPATRGTRPDAMAPTNPVTGSAKRYAQFPAFLRAMLYHELQS